MIKKITKKTVKVKPAKKAVKKPGVIQKALSSIKNVVKKVVSRKPAAKKAVAKPAAKKSVAKPLATKTASVKRIPKALTVHKKVRTAHGLKKATVKKG